MNRLLINVPSCPKYFADVQHTARNPEPPPTDNRIGLSCSHRGYRFCGPKVFSNGALFFVGCTEMRQEPLQATAKSLHSLHLLESEQDTLKLLENDLHQIAPSFSQSA